MNTYLVAYTDEFTPLLQVEVRANGEKHAIVALMKKRDWDVSSLPPEPTEEEIENLLGECAASCVATIIEERNK